MPGGEGMGKVAVDDAFVTVVEFENGAIGAAFEDGYCDATVESAMGNGPVDLVYD